MGFSALTERIDLDSGGLRTRTFDTLRQILLNFSRRRPVVLAVENVHWIDPTSEAYFESLTGSWPTGTWRLVKTVTAFTVAHSITLGLATLGFVHVPSKPVEAVIALSIVFVAAEIVQARRGRAGLAAQMPWIVAFTFGLLHGFGFAGALSEVGLPEGHIPVALLFFNLGVEAGQLLFVAAVLALVACARRIRVAWPRWAELVPPYAIGSVAMFWVIQRVAAF